VLLAGQRAALPEATDGENLRQAIIILGEQQQQLRTLQRITNLLSQRLQLAWVVASDGTGSL